MPWRPTACGRGLGKGRMGWPCDLPTLNPCPESWATPRELPQNRQGRTSHLGCISVPLTHAVTPGVLLLWLGSSNRSGKEEVRARGRERERYREREWGREEESEREKRETKRERKESERQRRNRKKERDREERERPFEDGWPYWLK